MIREREILFRILAIVAGGFAGYGLTLPLKAALAQYVINNPQPTGIGSVGVLMIVIWIVLPGGGMEISVATVDPATLGNTAPTLPPSTDG